MKDELLRLAERCEAATGPCRNLDNSIRLSTNNGCAFDTDPAFTASLDAAMTLVPEGYAVELRQAPGWRTLASLRTLDTDHKGRAVNFALALCATALRALAQQQPEGEGR